MFVSLQLMALLLTVSSEPIKITRGPQTTNASVDSSATFYCQAEGTFSPPIWNINRRDYRISDLPLYHEYFPEQYLRVFPIVSWMNGSVYYCYYITYVDGEFRTVQSNHATLLISSLVGRYNNYI